MLGHPSDATTIAVGLLAPAVPPGAFIDFTPTEVYEACRDAGLSMRDDNALQCPPNSCPGGSSVLASSRLVVGYDPFDDILGKKGILSENVAGATGLGLGGVQGCDLDAVARSVESQPGRSFVAVNFEPGPPTYGIRPSAHDFAVYLQRPAIARFIEELFPGLEPEPEAPEPRDGAGAQGDATELTRPVDEATSKQDATQATGTSERSAHGDAGEPE